jgi:hypothetical protein
MKLNELMKVMVEEFSQKQVRGHWQGNHSKNQDCRYGAENNAWQSDLLEMLVNRILAPNFFDLLPEYLQNVAEFWRALAKSL